MLFSSNFTFFSRVSRTKRTNSCNSIQNNYCYQLQVSEKMYSVRIEREDVMRHLFTKNTSSWLEEKWCFGEICNSVPNMDEIRERSKQNFLSMSLFYFY